MRTNERAKVVWRFKSRPEFLTVGSRLIFREGSTKGMGEVIKVSIEQNDTNDANLNGNSAPKKFKSNNHTSSPESKIKNKKASVLENDAIVANTQVKELVNANK